VNCNVKAAIRAHRAAFAKFQKGSSHEGLAMNALRAVFLAAGDDRTQLKYLTKLPNAAWESVAMRDEAPAAVKHHIQNSPTLDPAE
jgi:hypothetical protein